VLIHSQAILAEAVEWQRYVQGVWLPLGRPGGLMAAIGHQMARITLPYHRCGSGLLRVSDLSIALLSMSYDRVHLHVDPAS
jgi:hypothetical protein